MVPDSVAKMNRAGFPDAISQAGVPLKTCAVGEPVGILTTRALATGNGWPRPLYKVLVPDRLFDIQNGPVGFKAIPQGLVRLGSVWVANPGISETRFCTAYFEIGIAEGDGGVVLGTAAVISTLVL